MTPDVLEKSLDPPESISLIPLYNKKENQTSQKKYLMTTSNKLQNYANPCASKLDDNIICFAFQYTWPALIYTV